VVIDSIEGMRTLFDGIPLDEVSTSRHQRPRGPAAALSAGGEAHGAPGSKLTATIRNDVLDDPERA
jgi:methylmalonyl-CoA mutase N-terminal domain/subunit